MRCNRENPELVPFPYEEPPANSSLSVSIIEGPSLSLWTGATITEGRTKEELALRLQPEECVVIGRQEGGQIEYLDPRYQPTRMMPNSTRPVVTSLRHGADRSVSRGHFMLRGSLRGIVFVNGVPRRGGGLRPPLNGTLMLEPEYRSFEQGEEYVVERGTSLKIRLPNQTVVLICAE